MANVTFYTKIGCITATKQIELLKQAGHTVDVRDLLTAPWSAEELRSYFGPLPITACFNPNAPRITSGELDPAAYGEAAALALMVQEPLLIRRPLLDIGGMRSCGFDQEALHAAIGLAPVGSSDFDAVDDMQSCSVKSGNCP